MTSIETLQKGTDAYYVGGDLIAYINGKHVVLAKTVDGVTVLTPEGHEMVSSHHPLDGDWNSEPGGSRAPRRPRKTKDAETETKDAEPEPEPEPEVEPAEVQLDLADFLAAEDKMG